MSEDQLVDIVEIDKMTGNDRTMWMHVGISRESAEEKVRWLEKNITNRYGYEIVPTGTGPAKS